MTMILAYWDVRGFAGHIRLMLEYTKAKYEEKFYVVGDAPGFDKSGWFNEKFKLGLDFPNLPYLIDGNNKVTQSMAILRYLARKNNLCGDTEEQKIRIDMLEQQCLDLRASFVRMCYVDLEGLKPDYLKALPEALKLFSDFLGQRKWFAGDKLTYADFIMYEMLDMQRMFHPPCLDNFKNLKAFLDRFEALDGVSAYLKSDKYIKEPINNRMAQWSFKKVK
ncbi:glutathione S-transferase Mu 1-like isoform X1 [Poecilia latipinna]|uniref:glutathione transferase n=2 Tax=Poecilia TaxID=8080 RepID=A0A087Y624_POEFO|nr:PREDICTED: glutathione S-transferase Mu 1-like isoform X1 [Poecilia formosa]XP_014886460.1 PREDICTED: glutathione S-transferase Mu 1-like isoform X1 [Poecilia latipinna]